MSVKSGQTPGPDGGKNSQQWTLHIRDVKQSDQGGYMCQINTDPMLSQIGYLEVTSKM